MGERLRTKETPFKTCSMCGQVWKDRETFLEDESLELNGYSADFEDMARGLFYFTHKREGCKSTISISSGVFFDLYKGEKYREVLTGGNDCPRFCLKKDVLDRCDAFCEYAFVREVIQVILARQNRRQTKPVAHTIDDGLYTVDYSKGK